MNLKKGGQAGFPTPIHPGAKAAPPKLIAARELASEMRRIVEGLPV
jgi:hypothetical protein